MFESFSSEEKGTKTKHVKTVSIRLFFLVFLFKF